MKRIFLLLCILIAGVARGQVVNFTSDNTKGCAPLVVRSFTNLSTGNPVKYFWDFGNGNTSTQLNPGTIYFTPGNYNVKLVVEFASGRKDSLIKNNFISVSKIPEVNFVASSAAGCFPFPVRFTDQSVSTSAINKWEWDFGDGTSSSEKSPQHLFNFSGDFSVTLKITDEFGCGAVQTKTSFIRVDQRPKAAFTSTSAAACSPPIAIRFTNTTASGSYTNLTWDFGDGTTSQDSNPSHTYTRTGNFPVRLIVRNQRGCEDTIIQPLTIGSVNSIFTSPATVCQGVSANFFNSTIPAARSVFWDFGDNTNSTEMNPVKKYSAPGTFVVKLVNSFSDCKDSITKNITVLSNTAPDFTFTVPAASCKLPVDVTFTSTPAGVKSYSWDFGDGATSNLPNPTHTYNTFGLFTIKLVVTNAANCADSVVKSNIVSILPAKINGFNGFPFGGCLPVQPAFSPNISSPDPVTSYLWDFGDGSTSTNPSPAHQYNREGIYNVSLQITTASGCRDSFTLPAAVNLANRPQAAFSAAPRIACASDTIQFTDLTTGITDKLLWEFGDGTTSGLKNSSHKYSDTGFFTVRLIVGKEYCFDSLTVRDYVYINPPVARFTVSYDCSLPNVRVFQNKSVQAQTLRWTFGDGQESTDTNPTHSYARPGTYEVRLRVTNGGCTDEYMEMVKVIGEQPELTVIGSEICRNNTSVFTVGRINLENIAKYTWNFGDSTPILSQSVPVVNHNYINAGSYKPIVTVEDILGCKDTITGPVITIYGPKSDFNTAAGGCAGTPIAFTDRSVSSFNHPVTSWHFDYGDGTGDTSASPSFSHIYNTPKTYNVSLTVTDSYGCRDTVVKTNILTITNSKAAFSLSDSIFCNNSNISFSNQSTGDSLSYLWSFGDGSTTSTANPTHSYSSEGVYDVSLVVKDFVGCTDSVYKAKAITIGDVKASFSVDDSVISCPPAQINFVNNSLYTSSVKWIFDDGSVSTIANPTHYFSSARTYKVKLIAMGHGTCIDSTTKDIIVKGPRGSFTYKPVFQCAPASIEFTEDASEYNKSFTWDFGDGTTITSSDATISHVYKEPGKFFPKLFLEDTLLNCRVAIFGTDTITVSQASSYIKTNQNLFCDSASVQFFDSSRLQYDTITSYSWSFGDGTFSKNSNPVHSYVDTGLYPVSLIITTRGGCTDTSANSFINIVKSPRVQVSGPSETCVGVPVSFLGSVQSNSSLIKWNWDFGNEGNSTLGAPPSQNYSIAGSYLVKATVTDNYGCFSSDTSTLIVHPLPNLNAGADTAVCYGTSVTLRPTGASSYVWASNPTLSCTSCANPVANPVDTSVYYVVTGTSAVGGCLKTDTINVKAVQPFKIAGMVTDTLCVGESVKLSISGADNYNWLPAAGLSNANISNPVAAPVSTTLYTVIGRDYLNCFADTGYVPIVVYPIPVFNIAQEKITLSAGNNVTINTTSSDDITNWEWFPPTGLSCSNCPEPVTNANNTISYKATATNAGGCRAEDKVTVQVFCDNGNLFMPNTFSPNRDGINDVFFPRGKGIAGIRNLQIYSRSGVVVFQKSNFTINDPNVGWDGNYNGKPLDSDVFVYQVDVICSTGQVFSIKGDISLVR